MQTQQTDPISNISYRPPRSSVLHAIQRRHFATLATSSTLGRPHTAGVLYEEANGALYISTMRSSRKALNVEANPHVAVTIPIRRLPVGPPSTVHFQSRAEVLDGTDGDLHRLAAEGRLKSVTGHGELELEGGCFLRVPLPDRLLTYGLGMSIRRLVKDPLGASGIADSRS